MGAGNLRPGDLPGGRPPHRQGVHAAFGPGGVRQPLRGRAPPCAGREGERLRGAVVRTPRSQACRRLAHHALDAASRCYRCAPGLHRVRRVLGAPSGHSVDAGLGAIAVAAPAARREPPPQGGLPGLGRPRQDGPRRRRRGPSEGGLHSDGATLGAERSGLVVQVLERGGGQRAGPLGVARGLRCFRCPPVNPLLRTGDGRPGLRSAARVLASGAARAFGGWSQAPGASGRG
mmetsp:Transcript_90927/g.262084  ORF Transcript_90927/g.262084 Transcript_90927/m.262084 type:complete len:232 (+) Transcript_90927:2350-3045(+)